MWIVDLDSCPSSIQYKVCSSKYIYVVAKNRDPFDSDERLDKQLIIRARPTDGQTDGRIIIVRLRTHIDRSSPKYALSCKSRSIARCRRRCRGPINKQLSFQNATQRPESANLADSITKQPCVCVCTWYSSKSPLESRYVLLFFFTYVRLLSGTQAE